MEGGALEKGGRIGARAHRGPRVGVPIRPGSLIALDLVGSRRIGAEMPTKGGSTRDLEKGSSLWPLPIRVQD